MYQFSIADGSPGTTSEINVYDVLSDLKGNGVPPVDRSMPSIVIADITVGASPEVFWPTHLTMIFCPDKVGVGNVIVVLGTTFVVMTNIISFG